MILTTRLASLALSATLLGSALATAQEVEKAIEKTSDGLSSLGQLLPLGLAQKGVKLPEYAKGTGEGFSMWRSSLVEAASMTRLDDRNINLDTLSLKRFAETAEIEFELRLKTGKFDMESQILSSEERSVLESPDFVMEGDGMLFHSGRSQGRMEGNVVMTVHSSSSLAPSAMTTPTPTSIGEDPSGEKPKEESAEPEIPTVITTGPDGVAYMDAARRTVVFTGDVLLHHPDFDIWCDELQLYLKPEAAPEEVPPADAVAAAPEEEKSSSDALPEAGESAEPKAAESAIGGGIDIAVFLGRRVLIRKEDADGQLRIGQCRKATYYVDRDEFILQDAPQLQVGSNLFRGTAAISEIILRKDGEHQIRGPQQNYVLPPGPESEPEPATSQPE